MSLVVNADLGVDECGMIKNLKNLESDLLAFQI
jgi:hypothetical protein